MESFYEAKDWDEWQTYRKDRGAPPWIKVHRNLMSNPKWASLTDEEKGHLISIWIIAADNGGKISSDARLLRKICMLDNEPNMNKFVELDFFIPPGRQDDVKMTSRRRQSDLPETEAETELETDTELNNNNKKKEKSKFQALPVDFEPPKEWLEMAMKEKEVEKHIVMDWFEDFKNFWTNPSVSKTKNGKKANWTTTWKNHYRRINVPYDMKKGKKPKEKSEKLSGYMYNQIIQKRKSGTEFVSEEEIEYCKKYEKQEINKLRG